MPRRKNRWGRLAELNGVKKVPCPEFNALPNRLKHLSAWRAMHRLGSHKSVRGYATQAGIRPSSNLSLKKKLSYVLRRT